MTVLITGKNRSLSEDLKKIIPSALCPDSNEVDLTSINDIRKYFSQNDFDTIIHVDALFSVKNCEENKSLALQTNFQNTKNLVNAVKEYSKIKFIFISTDKATNPSTTLGASKLLAERITQDAGHYRGIGKTIFTIVRFGNVLGSRGSVFQIFFDNLKHNQSLTVTDERMTRFVMSLSESANLILKVTVIAKDGEIYILKMPSVKIIHLAKTMIKIFQDKYKKFDKLSWFFILIAFQFFVHLPSEQYLKRYKNLFSLRCCNFSSALVIQALF